MCRKNFLHGCLGVKKSKKTAEPLPQRLKRENEARVGIEPQRTVKTLESEKIVAFCTSVPIPRNSSKAALIFAFAWEIQSTKARPAGVSNNAFKPSRKKTRFAARTGDQGSFSFIFSDINRVNLAGTFFSIRDKFLRCMTLLVLAV